MSFFCFKNQLKFLVLFSFKNMKMGKQLYLIAIFDYWLGYENDFVLFLMLTL